MSRKTRTFIDDDPAKEKNPGLLNSEQAPAGISRDSYADWAEKLKDRIEIMAGSFRLCGLEEPTITCHVDDLKDLGVTLDFYVDVSGINGDPVKDGFALKLNLYTEDDRLVGAKEVEVTPDSFGGFDTFVFRFPDCKKLNILSYGKMYASRL